ncbi:hypothetical protein SB781_39610, partial [Paraburkholderia sp. SIMBA_061]
MNILNILDCVNIDQSIPTKYGGFKKFVFEENEIQNQHIFKTLSYNYEIQKEPFISSQTFVSDEFKQRVEEAGLQ